MRTIDIKTTQNVVITYEVAALRDRILAFILDLLFIGAGALIILLLTLFAGMGSASEWVFFGYFLFVTFYTLFFEMLINGQTPGKKILRIKVVSMDGRHLSFYDYTLRWSFRLMDVWFSLGTLGAILSSSGSYGQRMGGLVSNSTVVKLNPRFRIQLRDLLKISSKDSYTPQYYGVRNFSEQDMLLVKQTVERYSKFKNTAHKEAVLELVEVMKTHLGLTEVPKNKLQFLKTLIRDYVVLTR